MKLTNGEIFNVRQPLAELGNQQMPVKNSFAVLKLAKLLEPIIAPIEEMRLKLVKQYGDPSPTKPQDLFIPEFILVPDAEHEGRMVQIPNPKRVEFSKEWGEIMAEEVELEFDLIVLLDTVDISPTALMALEKFIKIK